MQALTAPITPTTAEASPEAACCISDQIKKKKAQSLDNLNCSEPAMWKSEVEEVILQKAKSKGLGFSILDYQDPLNVADTVIVVRSLVPGGVAQLDGRIVPGDRIVYVNQVRLEHASLDAAVQALKGAAYGPVAIGIARPVTEDDNMMSQLRDRLAAAETNTELVNNGCRSGPGYTAF